MCGRQYENFSACSKNRQGYDTELQAGWLPFSAEGRGGGMGQGLIMVQVRDPHRPHARSRAIELVTGYLYGEYKDGFVEDDRDNELRHRNLVSGQLALEF